LFIISVAIKRRFSQLGAYEEAKGAVNQLGLDLKRRKLLHNTGSANTDNATA
jgi:hypothetical protein